MNSDLDKTFINTNQIVAINIIHRKEFKNFIWRNKKIKKYFFGLFSHETPEGFYSVDGIETFGSYYFEVNKILKKYDYIFIHEHTIYVKPLVMIFLSDATNVKFYFDVIIQARSFVTKLNLPQSFINLKEIL